MPNTIQATPFPKMKQHDIDKKLERAEQRQLNREPRYRDQVQEQLDRRVAPRLREILREVPNR